MSLKKLSNPDSGSLDIVYGVDWNNLVDHILSIGKIIKKSTSPEIGTGSTFGSESTIVDLSNTDHCIVLQGIVITVSSIATGETITVRLLSYFDNGTSLSLDETFTVDGTYTYPITEIRELLSDTLRITKISTMSHTDQSSTTATVTVEVIGVYG